MQEKTDREKAFELAESESEEEISEERKEELIKTINSKLKKVGKNWVRYTNMSKTDQKKVFDAITELTGYFSISEISKMIGKEIERVKDILDRPPTPTPSSPQKEEEQTGKTEFDHTIKTAEAEILEDFRVSIKQIFSEDLVLGRELRARLGGLSPEDRKTYISEAIKFYEKKNIIKEIMYSYIRQIENLKTFISDIRCNVDEYEYEYEIEELE